MIDKQDIRAKVAVLGCGPIAQFAHLEGARKARNADLHAICDAADDLRGRMAATHRPMHAFADYDAMLADGAIDIVVIATADAFHVPMALKAIQAGKHVLVEKPMALSVGEAESLARTATDHGVLVQVGHNKRFDPGIEAARTFIEAEAGGILAMRAWYCDSTHRYDNTDALQPIPILSAAALRPSADPKADKRRYFLLTHGSHLFDLARFLVGEIVAVRARLVERFGAYSWFVETEFANGCNGHLDLTVAVRMDWFEGFHVYAEHGSVVARTFNPWFRRASEVDCFRERDKSSFRVLGPDGDSYRRQIEGFAEQVLGGKRSHGASVLDGVACTRAMRAVQMSVEQGRRVVLAEAEGSL